MSKAKYKHINLQERVEIYALWKQGKSKRHIAKCIGRNVSSVSRELKRNRTVQYKTYTPVKAHEIASKRAIKQRTLGPTKTPLLYLYVREKLKVGWSPEIISGRVKHDHPGVSISAETIYSYIYGRGKDDKLWEYLPMRRKKRKLRYGRNTHKTKYLNGIPQVKRVDSRSTKANNRKQVGHFETDLMEGPKTSRRSLSVLIDRKTRYTKLNIVESKQSKNKEKVLENTLKTIKSLSKTFNPIVRTMTSDNGTENSRYNKIEEKLNLSWYFTNPYHSWEKGSVERRIKDVRRYIPKGTDLNQYSNLQIQWLENMLNNRPMKCLNYLTPNETFEKEVNKYKFRKYHKQLQCSVALHSRM